MSLYKGAYTTLDPLAMHWMLEGPDGPVMVDTLERGERIKNCAASWVWSSRVRGGPGSDSKGLRDSGDAFIGAAPTGADTVPGGTVCGVVRFAKSYATFYNDGTRPHQIRAKNAPMLVFYWAKVGHVVAFPKVNHPGTKPTHFLSGALIAGSG